MYKIFWVSKSFYHTIPKLLVHNRGNSQALDRYPVYNALLNLLYRLGEFLSDFSLLYPLKEYFSQFEYDLNRNEKNDDHL